MIDWKKKIEPIPSNLINAYNKHFMYRLLQTSEGIAFLNAKDECVYTLQDVRIDDALKFLYVHTIIEDLCPVQEEYGYE